MEIQYKRSDGTFIALVNGYPYHVIDGDPLFSAAQAMADDLPMEPSPEELDPVPEKMSFPQMLIGLVAEGWITEAEGDAWLNRTALPAKVSALIDALPASERFAARARATAPSFVSRSDSLVIALAASEPGSMSLDEFFTAYA